MMNTKHLFTVAAGIAVAVSVSFAHLPSPYDASLKMGRTSGGGISQRSTTAKFSNKGAWSPDTEYRGSYAIAEGDTVSHGDFNEKKLWWWAKFYAQGENFTPGQFAPEGGTSPWVLINSLSAADNGTVAYNWRGWNGEMANMTGLKAEIPTWRDGAQGAYSFTHDDIGPMPFEKSVNPGWQLAKDFPEIKQCWGVYVDKMTDTDWDNARNMVLDGHEMFNHSMEHTSAADQWQWFYPGQKIPSHDPAIPPAIRGLTVVGTWGNPAAEPVYPVTGYEGIFESELVAIEATRYWTQKAPSSETPGTVLMDAGKPLTTVIEPVIYPKPDVEEIILPTGQKLYVKYTDKDESSEPTHEGTIAATGATWFESSQLDQYGGQYWKPKLPFLKNVPEWDWHPIQPAIQAGSVGIVSYRGKYYRVINSAGGEPVGWGDAPNPNYELLENYDPSKPALSSEGSFVGPKWSSTTRWVPEDQGSPGFVAKVFCVKAWTPEEYKLNIKDANDEINARIYSKIVTAGEHFRKGKKSEYFGYPFDAYSETTHDSLEAYGFVGARGGAKSGKPITGDFFHPYRIDFDAFYITNSNWTPASDEAEFVYPNNPHVLLGLNEMVDDIVSAKGYMIREFHAVTDIADGAWYNGEASEYWPINSAAEAVGGWWGGITVNQLRAHYEHVQTAIDANELAVYTVSEAVKYRMTANAVTGVDITEKGDNYRIALTTSDLPEKYHEEISVIISLPTAVDSLGVNYESVNSAWGASPRRRPVMMDTEGEQWSVSLNPHLGAAEIVPNGIWNGQGFEDANTTPLAPGSGNQFTGVASFAGIQNGQIALNLPTGNYSAELYNLQGRMVSKVDFNAVKGVNMTGLRTSHLGKGLLILNVRQAGMAVLQQRIMLR